MNWFDEKDTLKRLILEEKLSYEQIGRRYNKSGQAIRKAARKIGIELIPRRKVNPKEHFNKGKKGHKCANENCNNIIIGNTKQKYCCNKCQKEDMLNKKYKYYLEHQEEFINREISYEWLKKIILIEQNNRCIICNNINIWEGKELHFVLDHIDGDATNNKRNNLRLVCPNCDSQLPTFKARNIGKSTRKYKPYHIK